VSERVSEWIGFGFFGVSTFTFKNLGLGFEQVRKRVCL